MKIKVSVILFASVFLLPALTFANVVRSQDSAQPTKLNSDPSFSQVNVSRSELLGKITNKYGIRDDILQFIETRTFQLMGGEPEKMALTRHAAIKYASYSQQIYYEATQEEALKLARNELIALSCLSRSYDDWQIISRGINRLMKNNVARINHIKKIDAKFFAFKVWGAELTSSQHYENCQKGNF